LSRVDCGRVLSLRAANRAGKRFPKSSTGEIDINGESHQRSTYKTPWSEVIEGEDFPSWLDGFLSGPERGSIMTETKRDNYVENLDGLLAADNLPGDMRIRCIRAKKALLAWLPGTEYLGCGE
jgi:hypothetical protein